MKKKLSQLTELQYSKYKDYLKGRVRGNYKSIQKSVDLAPQKDIRWAYQMVTNASN